jgi:thymidylate kinase
MDRTPAIDCVKPRLSPAPLKEPGGPGRILWAVIQVLDRAGIPYCVLHGYESYPEQIKSDVDCLISAEVRGDQLAAVLHENRIGIGAEVVRFTSGHVVLAGKNPDGSPCFLDLDLSRDYDLHGLHFYTGCEVLRSRRRHGPFWVPEPKTEFGCYLVRRIAKADLDDEHGRRLSSLYHQDPAGCRQQIARFWGAGSTAVILDAAGSGNWDRVRRGLRPLRAELRRRAALRHPWRVVVGWLSRMARRLKRAWRPEGGLNVIVLGADGAGKSSVIQAVRRDLAGAFTSSTCHTFPPALLRRLLRRPEGPERLPHALPPRSFAASVTRALLYWFVYYTAGYYLTVHPTLARSTLVVHDRHLVDALVDPKRYRYAGPRWLLRFLWRLVPKPDLVILLDAPAALLQARKQEVAFEETARQCNAYRALLTSLPNGHTVDAARPLEQVVGEVDAIILRHLSTRIRRRFRLEGKT